MYYIEVVETNIYLILNKWFWFSKAMLCSADRGSDDQCPYSIHRRF